MKKLIAIGILTALAVLLVASCASKPATYADVYTQFKKELILEGAKSYTVVSGDNLSKITESFYGSDNGYYFPMIMGASSDVVTHPDKIAPGMILTVPDLKKNLGNPVTVRSIKRQFRNAADIYRGEGNAFVADKLVSISDSL